MSAPPVQPILIGLRRCGAMILLSTLLEILHRRYGGRCHVIGAGSWPGELYAVHGDVARVSCLHRYTAFLFDPTWWRVLWALRRRAVRVRAAQPGAHRAAAAPEWHRCRALPVPHAHAVLQRAALGGPPGLLRAAHTAGLRGGRLHPAVADAAPPAPPRR